MRKWVKTALAAIGAAALGGAAVAIIGMGGKARGEMMCTGLKVEFADSGKFVSAKDIEDRIGGSYGPFVGVRLDSLDLGKVESILDSMSAVSKTEAYTTPDGTLNVIVRQMRPAVRFKKGSIGFYSDAQGRLFPLQKAREDGVCLVEGEIPISYEPGFKGEPAGESERAWLDGVLSLVSYQASSRLWGGFFNRFLVNGDGDLVLVPAKGKERFIFGEPVDLERKFGMVEKYYTAVVPAKGEGYYSSVNVKYNGQLVCRE